MTRGEWWLVLLLRLSGAVMLLAWPAVFLPEGSMAAGHRWLGMGDFPASPLVDYLTRSISALYGIHGGLFLLLATDVRRYRRIVAFFGFMYVVFGAVMLGVDVHAGMPAYWTVGEGPMIVAAGAVMLALLRSVPRGEAEQG